jgi:FkbM family methyltransferase
VTTEKDTDVVMRPGTMDEFVFQEMARDIYKALEYVHPGDVVLDVGPNVGAFALHILTHVPDAVLICLEPMPSNCDVLRRNVGNRAIIEDLALGASPGVVTMYDFGDSASACHSLYDVGATGAQPVRVRAETLEGLMDRYELDHVRFLKLDCQGAEFEIIPSASHETLARIDCVAMEVHPSLWGLHGRIGNVPGSMGKMKRLYRHLIATHVPVHGKLYRGDVELWLNRRDVSEVRRLESDLKYRWANLYRPILYPPLRSLKRSAESWKRHPIRKGTKEESE